MKTRLLITSLINFMFLLGCAEETPQKQLRICNCEELRDVWISIRQDDSPSIVSGEEETLDWMEFGQMLFWTAGCNSCVPHSSGEWISCYQLSDALDELAGEKVQRIIFCEKDTENTDKFSAVFEVPQKALKRTVKLLEETADIARQKGYPGNAIWDMTQMEIVTDKSKYLVPTRWDSEKIYWSDWRSYKLREYLRKYGF